MNHPLAFGYENTDIVEAGDNVTITKKEVA
jgi:hypothetical protein